MARRARAVRTSNRSAPAPAADADAAQRGGPRTSSSTTRGPTAVAIAIVFGVALAVRAAHLWSLSASPFWTVTMGDAVAYLEWARRIADGHWLGTETFYQAPLYPYFLGTILSFSGASVAGLKIVQIVLGASSCALLAWAAGRLFRPVTGVVAGLILAVYPTAVFFDGLIQKTALDDFLLSSLVACVALVSTRASWPRTIGLGVVVGLLALTRENALIGLPLAIWWLWLRGGGWRPAAAGAVLGTALVLLPVGMRNLALGGRFQLTTSQFGPNLSIGNSDTATGLYVPLRPGHGSAEFERRDAIALAERAAGRALRPGEVSDYWTRQAVAWAWAHPGDWIRLTGKKLLLTWNAAEAADTEDIATHAESSPVLRLRSVVHFGVLAPLGLLGFWIHRARRRELGVLYALVPVYAASVAAFYVIDRYRFPLVHPLVVFAAAAATYGLTWWRQGSRAERLQGLAIVLVAAVACNWPLLSSSAMQATTAVNLGYALASSGRVDDAMSAYRRALALQPTHAPALASLGGLLTQRGEHDEALSLLQEAVRLEPTLPNALTNLGIELSFRQRMGDAVAVLERALAIEPSNVDAEYNLGVAAASLGDDERALRCFRDVIRAQPSHAMAQNNVGVILATRGDVLGAVEHFAQAVESAPANDEFARNLQRARTVAAVRSAAEGHTR